MNKYIVIVLSILLLCAFASAYTVGHFWYNFTSSRWDLPYANGNANQIVTISPSGILSDVQYPIFSKNAVLYFQLHSGGSLKGWKCVAFYRPSIRSSANLNDYIWRFCGVEETPMQGINSITCGLQTPKYAALPFSNWSYDNYYDFAILCYNQTNALASQVGIKYERSHNYSVAVIPIFILFLLIGLGVGLVALEETSKRNFWVVLELFGRSITGRISDGLLLLAFAPFWVLLAYILINWLALVVPTFVTQGVVYILLFYFFVILPFTVLYKVFQEEEDKNIIRNQAGAIWLYLLVFGGIFLILTSGIIGAAFALKFLVAVLIIDILFFAIGALRGGFI